MEVWQSVLLAIGGNTVLLAVLVWAGKSLFGHFLGRDIERHKSNLELETQQSIERLRYELQLSAQEHQVTFNKLQERRATVVAKVYSLLVDVCWEGESLSSPIEWAGEPSKPEKYVSATTALATFYRYFDKHRIYLPDNLCETIESLFMGMRSQIIRMGGYIKYDDATLPPASQEKKLDVSEEAWKHFKEQVPAARAALETELRLLIGDKPVPPAS